MVVNHLKLFGSAPKTPRKIWQQVQLRIHTYRPVPDGDGKVGMLYICRYLKIQACVIDVHKYKYILMTIYNIKTIQGYTCVSQNEMRLSHETSGHFSTLKQLQLQTFNHLTSIHFKVQKKRRANLEALCCRLSFFQGLRCQVFLLGVFTR